LFEVNKNSVFYVFYTIILYFVAKNDTLHFNLIFYFFGVIILGHAGPSGHGPQSIRSSQPSTGTPPFVQTPSPPLGITSSNVESPSQGTSPIVTIQQRERNSQGNSIPTTSYSNKDGSKNSVSGPFLFNILIFFFFI